MTSKTLLLDKKALAEAQTTVPYWHLADDHKSLKRDLAFRDFRQAFAFMTQVALLAEKADHHPEWSNVYNRVAISLSTHDAGGITPKDIALALAIDGALTQGGASEGKR